MTSTIKTWQYRVKVNGTWEGDAMKLEIDDLRLAVVDLEQRIKELERDARRYRWLREQDDSDEIFCMYGRNGPFGECGHCDIGGELLDKEIDHAMSEAALTKAVEISQEYKLP